VGGKQYAASVDRSGSGYTALIADLPGVSGSGASLDTAETNLVAKLDAFV
jgi:predicted RNase H-like HicB family nuclease